MVIMVHKSGFRFARRLVPAYTSPKDDLCLSTLASFIIIIIIVVIINALTVRVVGVPQMILQPVFSIFPCSPLPSGTCRTQGLSIPLRCLPTSSFVRLVFFTLCLVFFPLSLCLARRFWPDLMNSRRVHITSVCVSLRWSGVPRVVRLPAGSWHRLPRW